MSAAGKFDPRWLEPPDDATVDRAVSDYARLVREAYGARLKGIYLFGSRARGDHTPESDADIAVVLEDRNWHRWHEMKRLTHIAYDFILEKGVELQGWPIRESHWSNVSGHEDAGLIESIRKDARNIPAPHA